MAILEVLRFPDERLRTVARNVVSFDSTVQQIIDDMFETMYAAKGIGLAATQVDEHIQLVEQDAVQAREFIEQLRAEGQCVVVDYGIESNASRDCSHRLVAQEGKWAVVKNA